MRKKYLLKLAKSLVDSATQNPSKKTIEIVCPPVRKRVPSVGEVYKTLMFLPEGRQVRRNFNLEVLEKGYERLRPVWNVKSSQKITELDFYLW